MMAIGMVSCDNKDYDTVSGSSEGNSNESNTQENGNQDKIESLEFKLNEDKNSYSVIGFGSCTDTNIIIPSTYNGLPVTSIGYMAFWGCTSLTTINCEAESKPSDWNSNWNFCCPANVVWGYKGE